MKKKLSIFIALISGIFFQCVALSAPQNKPVNDLKSNPGNKGGCVTTTSQHNSNNKLLPVAELNIQRYESGKVNGYDSSIIGGQPILLVANKHSNTLSYVNPKTFKIIVTIPTGPNPHEITLTPDQRFAYLSSYEPPGNTISVIDLLKRKQIKQIGTGNYGRIHGAAMAPDGKHAYFTAGQSGFVIEIDTKANEITRTIPTHGKISHMVYVSPDGKYLYTSNIVSESVSVIDLITGKLITQIPCGPGCEGMAFTPDGKYIWVANQTAGTITIVDIASYKPIETFECKGMPVRLRFTSDGKLALVAGWVKDGTLAVIDVATHKEIKRIRVGDYAIGVELTPDEKFAFVGCEDSMEARVLPDGTEKINANEGDSDGVHVIDMKTLSVIAVIKTGLGPDPMTIWYPPAN